MIKLLVALEFNHDVKNNKTVILDFCWNKRLISLTKTSSANQNTMFEWNA